ncbi:hypothetical protein MKL09_02610 [Methylobacterium sp. J-048]|uniref:hypothetical protein n=1 Tax=Methylobacterium sp. J-048 TaxID=2836635 RepID=UPI001FB8E168|nr:hypothetical protein [Methylobacterium sp. J-048]MCJ2055440.1 hypothetical protein [Methylobacterium sp. J-048]
MTQPPISAIVRARDWMFRDRGTGAITVAQWPNLPLWLFLGLTLAAWLARSAEPIAAWLGIAADLALGWWAIDELVRGVNPWRRLLGLATLLGLAALVTLRSGG